MINEPAQDLTLHHKFTYSRDLLCTTTALVHVGIETQFDGHKSVAQVVFQRDSM